MNHLEQVGMGQPHCIKSSGFKSSTLISSHLQVDKKREPIFKLGHGCTSKEQRRSSSASLMKCKYMFQSKNTYSNLDGFWRSACCLSVFVYLWCLLEDELTISVSDTGPKLVTKIFVLISVTFSVDRTQLEVKGRH